MAVDNSRHPDIMVASVTHKPARQYRGKEIDIRKFVFWTDIYDIVMASAISCPWVVKMLGVPLPESYFWLWFMPVLAIYPGVVLVIASRK